MATNGLDVFKLSMRASRSPNSHGGEAITMKETQSALRAVVFSGNMSVDKDDYAAVKKYFLGDEFLTYASDQAVDVARDFLVGFKGRWPDVVNAQAPKYEPGKLYSLSRRNMPSPPDGYAWDFRGADPTRPGNVMAKLVDVPPVTGNYIEGKLYSVERSNMPALPQGYAWALSGLDPTKPGHVLARLVREQP